MPSAELSRYVASRMSTVNCSGVSSRRSYVSRKSRCALKSNRPSTAIVTPRPSGDTSERIGIELLRARPLCCVEHSSDLPTHLARIARRPPLDGGKKERWPHKLRADTPIDPRARPRMFRSLPTAHVAALLLHQLRSV